MRLALVALGLLLCTSALGQDGQKLSPPDTSEDGNLSFWFGYSVDILVNWAVIGAPQEFSGAGAAYISYYGGGGEPWGEVARLQASDRSAGARFGTSVAIDNRWIAIGALYEHERGYHAGAVYMYRLDGSVWTEAQKIMPPVGVFGGEFGTAVAIDEDVLVVGSPGDSGQAPLAGAAYVYRYDGSSWLLEEKLVASDAAEWAFFGTDVTVDADRIAVGAAGSAALGESSGAAYVFTLHTNPSNYWLEEARVLPSDGKAGDHLGQSLALDGEVLVVGAYKGPPAPTDDRFGAAYVFRRSGLNWTEEAKLEASDGESNNYFGWTVDAVYSRPASGYVAVVGAHASKIGEAYSAGAVYVFKEDGATWSEVVKLAAPVPDSQEQYGFSVAADEMNLVVGALGNKEVTALGGMAYIYTSGLLVVDVEDPAVVSDYRLNQNYPNPFNPVTTIQYTLPSAGDVSLAVYDLLGHEVRTLESGRRAAGTYDIRFDASGLASGIYLYRLRVGSHVESRSLVVLK